MKIKLSVNGLEVEAHYSDTEIETVHKPLLKRLAQLQRRPSSSRTVIFLSAPPGTGKSTLTAFWTWLAEQDSGLPAIQTLPMDGFHHYNSWLEQHNLRARKGAPETFNVEKLAQNLQDICSQQAASWPQYSRQLHEPVEAAIQVISPLVIVEGNWLLLDDERWALLRDYCDFSLFIRAPAGVLRERLIARKMAGGLSRQEAEAFYRRTDGPNVEKVLSQSVPASLTLEMESDGGYRLASPLTV